MGGESGPERVGTSGFLGEAAPKEPTCFISELVKINKFEINSSVFRADRQLSFFFLDSSGDKEGGLRAKKRRAQLRGKDPRLGELCRGYLTSLKLDDLAGRVVVEWNPKMRSSAGRAYWPHGLIQLNPRLLEISDAEVRRTLLHELAHLIAYERHPYRRIKGHGKEWRQACVDVGIPNEKATHQLALPSRTMRRQWQYECPACHKSFERVRRFKSAVACYECCRVSAGGNYHDDFRLIERRVNA
jgi:predicted SprT family Zn-dependent metalloprotease